MKKFKYIFLMIAVAILGISCNDDGGSSVRGLEAGIVPDLQKDESTDAFLNLIKINNGDNPSVSFSVDIAQGDASSVNIIGVYYTASGLIYNAVLFSDVSLPADFTLSATDIIAAFAELNSSVDITVGDIISISASFTRSDGTVLNIINSDGSSNVNSNLTNSGLFTTVINYPVSCPSDIGGTYLVSSTGEGCCGVSPITDYQYTVTVTDEGGGIYSLSDYSGGVYDGLFCGPFGICGDASIGNITDICGVLSGSAADCCGDSIDFAGSVNEDGTWSVEVSSGFILAESIWTKQ